MAENKEYLWCGHLLDGGVPYHHALGSAKASHISIERGDFFAGLHFIHAAAWDVKSASLCDLLDCLHQFRIFCFQRLEFIEKRINEDRGDEHKENHDGYQHQPGIEPPSPRTLAEDGLEEPQNQRQNRDIENHAFAVIGKP